MESEIREAVAKLAAQVHKNTKAIAQTGQLVLDIQIQGQRKEIENLSLKDQELQRDSGLSNSLQNPKDVLQSEVVTQDDIVELVNELQGQLDTLDEKSVRRTANAFVADDTDAIAPLPSRDGQFPADSENFPKTLREFKDLDAQSLEYWLRWYELLPPDEAELEQILSSMGTSINEIGADKPEKLELSGEDIDGRYDTLARYLGLRNRRTPRVW